MTRKLTIPALTLVLLLAGCVSMPSGPSSMALPGTGVGWDRFRGDDAECRGFASAQVGGVTPDQAAATSGVNSAAVGALVGAAAGAAIGGGAEGAWIGAGAGLATGALAGTGAANASSYELQRRYDGAYLQCMYAKGHKIPVYGNYSSQQSSRAYGGQYAPPPPPPPR